MRVEFRNVRALVGGEEVDVRRVNVSLGRLAEDAPLDPGTFSMSGTFTDGTEVCDWTVPPDVPVRVLLPGRRWGWFPRWQVVEYSREPGRPLIRRVHRRWWFVSYRLVRWWLRRRFGLDPGRR